MPEPNTPWYAWSGTVNGNRPGDYVKAWKHVRGVLTKTAGKKVKLLWSVYARSVPDDKKNAISVYFPGTKQVDLVGADAYNFGNAQGLTWTAPGRAVRAGLRTIQKLAKRKPFWISETGSTGKGGDKARLDRRARTARQDHAEARRGRLVRRPRQHRRLPRAAQGSGRRRVQGVRPRRVQVMASAAMRASSRSGAADEC